MLKWGICAIGAILALWGLWWGYTGYSVVEVERGWSALLSGATVFSAGAIILAIGALMARLDSLIEAVRAQSPLGNTRAEAALSAPQAQPTQWVPQGSEEKDLPVAPPKFAPATVSVASTPLPVAANEAGPFTPSHENVAVIAVASVSGAAALTAVAASLRRAVEDNNPGISGDDQNPSMPEAPAPIPLLAPTDDGAEEPEDKDGTSKSAQEPRRQSTQDSGQETVQEFIPATIEVVEETIAPVETIAPAESLPHPLPERSGFRRATVQIPQLAPAPVHAEWPEAPPQPREESVQPAVRTFTPSRISLPPRPTALALPAAGAATAITAAAISSTHHGESEGAAEESVHTEPTATPADSSALHKPEPAGSDAADEAETPPRLEIASVPGQPPVPKPALAPEQPEWVGKLFEELDQLNEAELEMVALPPHVPTTAPEPEVHIVPEREPAPQREPVPRLELQPQREPARQPEPAPEPLADFEKAELRPSEAPEGLVESEPDSPRQEPAFEPAEAEDEPPAQPQRAVVRSYESQGVTYHLYDDGSIDADTSGGRFHFGSLDELRDFIAKRST